MTKRKQTQANQKGLYQSDYEHDACGVGMVVNIHGGKSHDLVDNALKVLENMEHRGAETRDKTGDGAGIMVQIPHEFILLQGIPVPEKGKYGTGLVFLPKDVQAQQEILSVMIEEIEREGLTLMHLRAVPTNPEVLGAAAREVEPDIKQIFVTGIADEDSTTRTSTSARCRTRILSIRECLLADSCVATSLICRMIILQVDWRWYTRASLLTHSQSGSWLSHSVCWPTTVKLTPFVVTVVG